MFINFHVTESSIAASTLIENNSIAIDAVAPRANYGVKCAGCGRDDCMTYIGMEQIGIGGTLYHLKYKCSNCGAITYWVLQSRET